MIHLYAFTREVLPTVVRGISDARVDTEDLGGLLAVVSHHLQPPPTTARTALAHVEVIEAVGEQADVLPVRFGRGHRDLASLRTKLEPELSELRARLDEVGAHVEFLARPAVPVGPSASHAAVDGEGTRGGRAYLEQRRAHVQRAADERAAEAERLRQVTEELAMLATSTSEASGPRGVERCFLVPKDHAVEFGATARRLADASGGIVVGGPWPPFTFAGSAHPREVGV